MRIPIAEDPEKQIIGTKNYFAYMIGVKPRDSNSKKKGVRHRLFNIAEKKTETREHKLSRKNAGSS